MRFSAIGYFFLGPYVLCTSCGCNDFGIVGDTGLEADSPSDSPVDFDTMPDEIVADGPCGNCDDEDICTYDICNTTTLECEHIPLDLDEDGFLASHAGDGTSCGGSDCDDNDSSSYPGADEICGDGVDQDCDGSIDGPLIVSGPVRITDTGYTSNHPKISRHEHGFGVSWVDTLSAGGSLGVYKFKVIDYQGEELVADVFLSDVMESPCAPAVAKVGGHHWVTWCHDSDTELKSIRVSILDIAGGTVTTLANVSDGGVADWPAIANNDAEAMIVWSDFFASGEGDDLFLSVLNSDGGVISDRTRLSNNDGISAIPSVAKLDDEYGVVWVDTRDGPCSEVSSICSTELYFRRVGDSGSPIGDEIRITTDSQFSTRPDIVADSGKYYVLWGDSQASTGDCPFGACEHSWGVYLQSLNADGSTDGGIHSIISDSVSEAFPQAVIFNGILGTVWISENEVTGVWQISYASLSLETSAILHHLNDVSGTYKPHGAPSMDWNGGVLGIVWSAEQSDDVDVYYVAIEMCD